MTENTLVEAYSLWRSSPLGQITDRLEEALIVELLGSGRKVLEQRVARIHRMGQERPVQIVNFVAKGTIEEGMLSVLAFKRSVSAGILDGGDAEITLGGSRLNRFMKEVENVTGRMGNTASVTPAEEIGTAQPSATLETGPGLEAEAGATSSETRGPVADPWQALAEVGTQLVSAFASADDHAALTHPWIERNPATGARCLKVPLLPPDVVSRIAQAFSSLAEAMRRR
jgi:hypothetical protein